MCCRILCSFDCGVVDLPRLGSVLLFFKVDKCTFLYYITSGNLYWCAWICMCIGAYVSGTCVCVFVDVLFAMGWCVSWG